MDMNRLREQIAVLEAQTDRNELTERLLHTLREKETQLGVAPTEEEVDQAMQEALAENLRYALKGMMSSSQNSDGEDEWDEEMDKNMETVHGVFRDMDLHYHDYVHQPGVRAFEMNVTNKGRKLRVKVYLEASSRVCRIDAIYPFEAEAAFAYPLCEKLAKENYPRRFGALQYDTRDGELSYRYSFPITHGLYEDDFRTVFIAVLGSAHASYDVVKQYSVGRFHRADRDAITCQAQKLIIELDQ